MTCDRCNGNGQVVVQTIEMPRGFFGLALYADPARAQKLPQPKYRERFAPCPECREDERTAWEKRQCIIDRLESYDGKIDE